MFLKQAFSLASPSGNTGRLSILIFHRVLVAKDPLFPDEPDVQRFDNIAAWISTWFNVLPLDEAIERLRKKSLPERAAAITFDDGYADNLQCALPVLQRYRLHATFFVASGFIGGGRMWNDTVIESLRSTTVPSIDASFLGLGDLAIKTVEEKRSALSVLIPSLKHLQPTLRSESVCRLAEICQAELPPDLMLTQPQLLALRNAGMTVGAHTVNHPILATLSDSDARREIADSRDFLEGVLRVPVTLFAYPNGKLGGDYQKKHAEMVRSLGFRAAFSTNWGVCSNKSDLFQLPRFTPWDTPSWRFGLRMLRNFCVRDQALQVGAS